MIKFFCNEHYIFFTNLKILCNLYFYNLCKWWVYKKFYNNKSLFKAKSPPIHIHNLFDFWITMKRFWTSLVAIPHNPLILQGTEWKQTKLKRLRCFNHFLLNGIFQHFQLLDIRSLSVHPVLDCMSQLQFLWPNYNCQALHSTQSHSTIVGYVNPWFFQSSKCHKHKINWGIQKSLKPNSINHNMPHSIKSDLVVLRFVIHYRVRNQVPSDHIREWNASYFF